MPETNQNLLSVAQVDADLFMAASAIQKAEAISSKAGKHLRGLAGYHLQQAAEKMIKIQIYDSGVQIDHSKMFRHSLDDLIGYASSLAIPLTIPSWVDEKKYVITSWEAEGRYNLHFVVRMDTLKRCYSELIQWRNQLFPDNKNLLR